MSDEEGSINGGSEPARAQARGADDGHSAGTADGHSDNPGARVGDDDRQERDQEREEGSRLGVRTDEDEVATVDEIIDGEIADESVSRVRQRIETWEAPLPPPAALEHYEQILPGAASRVFAMAEKQLEIRETREQTVKSAVDSQGFVERTLATADADALKRGQYLATIMSVTIGALAFAGMFLTPWSAIGFVVPIGQVAVTVVRTVTDGHRPDSGASSSETKSSSESE